MKINLRTIFLKSVPYLMSIAGGIILYAGAIDNAPNANIRDLVINVSASLLSIPLVFLLYDYMNYRVSTQMKRALTNTMTDKLNFLILNIILVLRESMGIRTRLNLESLNRMLVLRGTEISHRLKVTPRITEKLQTLHGELDTILYRNGQNNIFDTEQIHILSSLARDLAHLMNESKFHRNKHQSAKYIEAIMGHILDWLDADSVAAMTISRHLEGPQTPPTDDVSK